MPAVAHNDLKINSTLFCLKRQVLYQENPEAEIREQDTTWLNGSRSLLYINVQRIFPDVEGLKQFYVRVYYKEELLYTYTNIVDSEHFENYWNGQPSTEIETIISQIQNLEY